jgi:hypothetical protein
MEAPEPKLEHLLDMHADLEAPQVLAGTPAGMRQIFIVEGGSVEGLRITGKILPGGGDWAMVRGDGAIQLDVRGTIQSDDGALIYITYSGLLIADPAIFGRLLQAEDVKLNEYYFYINPVFQTGAPQYAWLNQRIAIGRGKVVPGGVDYRVWTIENAG